MAAPAQHSHQAPHPGSAAAHGFRPGGGAAAQAYKERTGIRPPSIVAWEITRSCNLSCAHCRAAAEFGAYPGELTLDQCKALIDDICSITNPILILTGGEPFMRPDIWDIIDYAREKGAMPVIGTNGTVITEEIAAHMAEHRIKRISVSIDFPDAEGQDAFRGKKGAFDDAIRGIRIAEEHGIGVQVNTTVTKQNADKMDDLLKLAEDIGAAALHPFFLVPTGRGESLRDIELSPDEYEEVLNWVWDRQKTSPLYFKPTDAPHYYRVAHQKAHQEDMTGEELSHVINTHSRGCLGGISFVFISHVGDVQPCGYFDMQLGNVLEEPFSKIWTESPVFNNLRDYSLLKGKCGACEFKAVCGGCRARALSATGDYLAEEPYCSYIPKGYQKENA